MPQSIPSADDILARAAANANQASRTPAAGEILAEIAAGSLVLADIDDRRLEELADRFGIDTIVDAIRHAPMPADAAPPAEGDAAQSPASGEVLPFSGRRRLGWRAQPTWFAAAAVLCLVSVATVLLMRGDTAPEQSGGASAGTPAAPPKSVLVLVRGNDPDGVREAESALLRTAMEREGLEPLDPAIVSTLRDDNSVVDAAFRGDAEALARICRQYGLAAVVVGDLKSRAVPANDRRYAGVAELSLKLYRPAQAQLITARNVLVGPDDARTVAASSAVEARVKAAQEVMNQAASLVRGWFAQKQQ